MTGDRVQWYRRISLRLRMLIVSAGAVALVLAIGGILLISLVREQLIDVPDDLGEEVAEDISELARAGELPRTLELAKDDEVSVQVVQDGRVISQTSDGIRSRRFANAQLDPGKSDFFDRTTLPVDQDGPFRIVALGTATPTGPATIFVAVEIEDLAEVMTITRQVGSLGLVVLVLVLSGVLWVVIGRTLAPVAAIRARTDAITGADLDRRVPEPASHDEISDLARTINAMLGRLETSARKQEAFVADAAHELRSPIAGLRARLEATLQTPGRTEDDQHTRDLLHETVRMGRLVDHLLLLARSDAGTIDAARVPVDMEEVVRETVAAIETVVPISTEHVEPVQVRGQSDLLEHVVRNLLENAGRYATDSIAVSLNTDGTNAVLTVDDDGPGIPADRRDDVVNRFVRIDESRDRGTGGSGLGLAIVHEIVDIHDGELEILDSPAGGARLQVTLPLP